MSVYVIKSLAKKTPADKNSPTNFWLPGKHLSAFSGRRCHFSVSQLFAALSASFGQKSVQIPVGTKTFVRVAASAGRRSAVKAGVGVRKRLAPPAERPPTRLTVDEADKADRRAAVKTRQTRPDQVFRRRCHSVMFCS